MGSPSFPPVGLSATPPPRGAAGAGLVPYGVPRSRPGPKLAKGDATTPPYALGFTVGSTISEDGKFLANVALRARPPNTGQTHPVTAQTAQLAASNYRVAVSSADPIRTFGR